MNIVYNEQSVAALILLNKLEKYYNEKYSLELMNQNKDELIINCYLAGGACVNFYTGSRGTADLDFELDKRIEIPLVKFDLENNFEKKLPALYIDTNYTASFGLLYGNYQEDAVFLDVYNEDRIFSESYPHLIKIRPHLFSPEDLIISKLSRWEKTDREDAKELVQHGLVDRYVLEEKINDALIDYIGLDTFLNYNIKELYDYFLLPEKNYANEKRNLIISNEIYDEEFYKNLFKPEFIKQLDIVKSKTLGNQFNTQFNFKL